MRRITCILLSVFTLCFFPMATWADTEINTWSALQTALNSSGTVKLTANITASSSESRLEINSAVTVTLDLNGYILSRGLTDATKKDKGQVINIDDDGASLTITDSNPSAPHVELTNPNGDTFMVAGGVITGGYTHGSSNDSNGGAIRVNAGTLTLAGGTICGNQASGGSGESSAYGIGGAIYLQAGCTFNMTGGSICYNKAHITGGVHCRRDCSISLSGGNIENNVSAYKAGGLAINSESGDSGTFKLSGSVVIKNNTNSSGANNLYLYNIKYKIIKIQGSLAGSDIGVSWADSDPYVVFTNGYDSTNSGILPTTYFSADNSTNYSIGLQGGEVKITNKTLQNAYAVLSGTTLTFYFDNNQDSRSGTIYDIRNWLTPTGYEEGTAGAVAAVKNVTKAVFDSSFSSYTFTAGDNWFHGFNNLTAIEGMENFNVSQATNLSWMFAGCSSLTSLDLNSWDTSKAYHFNNMFNGCTSLTKVTIGPNFKVDDSFIDNNSGSYIQMFTNCTHYSDGTGTITISGSTVPTIGKDIFGDITDGLLVANSLTADQLGLTSDEDAYWLYKGGKFRKFNGQRGYIVIEGNQYAFVYDNQLALRKYNYSGALSTERATIGNSLTKNSTNYQMVAVQVSAFDGQNTLLSISLPASVKSIGNKSFEDCTSLRWLDLSTAENYSPASLERTTGGSVPFANVPKQALIFLYGPTPEGANYIYYDGTDYTCDRMIIYDDTSGSQTSFSETNGYRWAYENPHPFTARTLQNTRRFTEGQHYTVCLPYTLLLPPLLKAYTMSASSPNVVGFMETTGLLTAFMPYVVVPLATGQLLSTTNVTVPSFTYEVDAKKLNPVSVGSFTMYGTMCYMDGSDANGLYIMQGTKTWAKIADSEGAYPNDAKKYCILPMRAYLKNSSAGAARPYLVATFTDIDGTTHTQALQLDEDSPNGVLYDLMGRRIDNPRRGNLYINSHGKMQK